MIKIIGVTKDVLDDINEQIGSLAVLDVFQYPDTYDACNDVLYDIELNEKLVALGYSKDMGVKIIRFEILETRQLILDNCRFKEVSIQ